jgi:hypothetical protein
VCKCVLPTGDNPIAVNKYIKIKKKYELDAAGCGKERVVRCNYDNEPWGSI